MGHLRASVSLASHFISGHDLTVHEIEPRIGLRADSSEPGACFGFFVSLPLCPSPTRALSKNEYTLKKFKTVFFYKPFKYCF